MLSLLPDEIAGQVLQARSALEQHLGPELRAIHLYGSTVDGGLKPASDVDLLVTVSRPPSEPVRRALVRDLLPISVPLMPMGNGGMRRPLEVTIIAHDQVVPWRYPPRRELQFGEWLREDLLAGVLNPPAADPDVTILVTKARQRSIALFGPPAATLFEPVPREDLIQALADIIDQWNTPEDWYDDERNVVLTLARIWYTAETGHIASKDVAAAWLVERVPAEHRPVLVEARKAYLAGRLSSLSAGAARTAAFIYFAKAEIERMLHRQQG